MKESIAGPDAGAEKQQPAEPEKKAWIAPRIVEEEVLEAVAATCGPPTGKDTGLCGSTFS